MRHSIAVTTLFAATVLGCAGQGVDRVDTGTGTVVTPENPNLGEQNPNKPGEPHTVVKTVFYAHTNNQLFEIDATSSDLPMHLVGTFDCVGKGNEASSITDLAVDEAGRIFLVANPTSGKNSIVFLDVKINGDVVECAGKGVQLSEEGSFYGATFAPKGTVLPNAEALVVANDLGELYEVNTSSAQTTLLGNFGVVPAADPQGHTFKNKGTQFALSGDIVFMSAGGNPLGYATVRDCSSGKTTSCSKTDTLVEIDMSKLRAGNTGSVVKKVRGQVVKSKSCSDSNESYGSMYGVAAYQNQIYGFARTSVDGKTVAQVVRIDNSTGEACLVADQTSLTKSGFAGAGVTTSVEVSAPVQ